MIIILVFRPDGFKWIQGIYEAISKDRVPGVGTARYFIVIAERKGFPPVGQQSLAHCLQNMSLKANALDLGFYLVSATAEIAKIREFCDLVGLPFGEFEINGWAVGYQLKKLPSAKRQALAACWRENLDSHPNARNVANVQKNARRWSRSVTGWKK